MKTAFRFRRPAIPYLLGVVIVFITAMGVVIQIYSTPKPPVPNTYISYFQTDASEITLTSPPAGAVIQSPLVISGAARGNWYFEAVFQATLVNWDGLIIAESYVEARSDWMTENLVPFEGVIAFEVLYDRTLNTPEFMKRGTLILRVANPSGLSEHDGAIEVPVRF